VIRRTAAAPAGWALRTYWGTAVMLAAACAAALCVLLPVASLVGRGAGLPSRLGLPAAGAVDLGLGWGAFVTSPDAIRAAAVGSLSHLLFGAAAGVVAVAWLTTLSLSVARAAARAPEIAVRRAVGATRLNLLGAALLEGAAIAVAALVVGGATGLVAARVAAGAWPGGLSPAAAAPAVVATAFTLAGIVLGALLPLVYARPGATLVTAEEAPLTLVAPVLQLGVGLAVLVAGSMLNRGAAGVRRTTPAESGDVFEVTTRGSSPAERAGAYAAVLRDLATDPAVAIASLASPGGAAGLGPLAVVVTDCGACRWGGLPFPFHTLRAAHYLVSADTFRAFHVPLVAGRGITDADRWGSARVAVVSRSLAQLHFEAEGAVGRRIQVGHDPEAWYTVVGVVDDRAPLGLGGYGEPADAVYLSVLQHPAPAVELLVRGRGPGAGAAAGRALRASLGPHLGTVTRVTEARLLDAEAAPLSWFGGMLGAEGWAMLLIAVAGTFAVMWVWVTSLLRELGVRRALGARRRDVLRFVLSRAGLVALAGIAFGLWVGTMVWDALSAAVAGLPAWDPHAVLRYGLLLGAATLAGAFVPAWRATRATPARLLGAP